MPNLPSVVPELPHLPLSVPPGWNQRIRELAWSATQAKPLSSAATAQGLFNDPFVPLRTGPHLFSNAPAPLKRWIRLFSVSA